LSDSFKAVFPVNFIACLVACDWRKIEQEKKPVIFVYAGLSKIWSMEWVVVLQRHMRQRRNDPHPDLFAWISWSGWLHRTSQASSTMQHTGSLMSPPVPVPQN